VSGTGLFSTARSTAV